MAISPPKAKRGKACKSGRLATGPGPCSPPGPGSPPGPSVGPRAHCHRGRSTAAWPTRWSRRRRRAHPLILLLQSSFTTGRWEHLDEMKRGWVPPQLQDACTWGRRASTADTGNGAGGVGWGGVEGLCRRNSVAAKQGGSEIRAPLWDHTRKSMMPTKRLNIKWVCRWSVGKRLTREKESRDGKTTTPTSGKRQRVLWMGRTTFRRVRSICLCLLSQSGTKRFLRLCLTRFVFLNPSQ